MFYFRDFIKFVIWRQSLSSLFKFSSCWFEDIKFRLPRSMSIFAFSKFDLRAIFKKFLNSFFECEPDPSAMLFDMDIPEALSCSANLNSYFFSSSSAMSKSASAISMANCHIFKSWNLNFTISFLLVICTIEQFIYYNRCQISCWVQINKDSKL